MLAAVFGKQVEVIGFDIHAGKIKQLVEGYDATGELTSAATNIDYTTDPKRLAEAQFLIVINESTGYPDMTEDIVTTVLVRNRNSNLKDQFNEKIYN